MAHPNSAPPPVFIDFEGIDGSGKTTLSNRLAEFLAKEGIAVHHGRSGGVFRSEISREIRLLTRDPRFLRMSDVTELLLYVARDTQMIDEFIRPRLQPGNIVFSDRYLYSAIAHSHFARGVARDQVDAVVTTAARNLWPDVVVYCDVDPLTSRVRKKIQKIRDRRKLGDFGRKGLMGIGFREEMRNGFLQMAKEDPERWIVIDNANSTLEASLQRIFERIKKVLEAKGYPVLRNPGWADLSVVSGHLDTAFASHVREVLTVADEDERRNAVCQTFFEELRRLVDTNPSRAGLHLVGIDTPEANEIRELIVDREPEIVAYGLRGIRTPESIELRHRLKTIEPRHVARSLTGYSPEMMQLREELVEKAPAYVALSVRGSDSEHAWDIRKRIGKKAIREVLISLRGLDTEHAWAIRRKRARDRHFPAFLESLAGIDTAEAWEWREQLGAEYLPWTLMSLRRVFSDRAWELRAEHISRAPKIIVKGLGCSDDPRAWELREKAKSYAKEVLDSLSGMDNAAAWQLRVDLQDKWPNTAVSSIGASVQSERAWKFRWSLLGGHPDNLLLLKHVAKAVLRILHPVDPVDPDDDDDDEVEDFT